MHVMWNMRSEMYGPSRVARSGRLCWSVPLGGIAGEQPHTHQEDMHQTQESASNASNSDKITWMLPYTPPSNTQ